MGLKGIANGLRGELLQYAMAIRFPLVCATLSLHLLLVNIITAKPVTLPVMENLAAATAPLRGLLKTSDDFLWTEDHTRAFNAAKDTLFALTTLSFFQVGQPLRLETDASVLKGL